jgi:hypothetical protein
MQSWLVDQQKQVILRGIQAILRVKSLHMVQERRSEQNHSLRAFQYRKRQQFHHALRHHGQIPQRGKPNREVEHTSNANGQDLLTVNEVPMTRQRSAVSKALLISCRRCGISSNQTTPGRKRPLQRVQRGKSASETCAVSVELDVRKREYASLCSR